MALVTLEQAQGQLRDWAENNTADVEAKLEQAEAIVLERCNSTAYWRAITSTWTDVTVPLSVKTAILLVLTHLYENRGNDMKADADLYDAIDRVLAYNRDRVIA